MPTAALRVAAMAEPQALAKAQATRIQRRAVLAPLRAALVALGQATLAARAVRASQAVKVVRALPRARMAARVVPLPASERST